MTERTAAEYRDAFTTGSLDYPDDEVVEHAVAVLTAWSEHLEDDELGRATRGVIAALQEHGVL